MARQQAPPACCIDLTADALTLTLISPPLTHLSTPSSCFLPPAPCPLQDVKKGMTILCADGSISLEVLSTDPAAGTVRVKCLNTAKLG